ncbi:MAG TPA: hypothetical protein ENJ08_14400 [Gammaproteobacteria bacterium]|nr:hypothetical protein [Gammaproteobacteria bacterium]
MSEFIYLIPLFSDVLFLFFLSLSVFFYKQKKSRSRILIILGFLLIIIARGVNRYWVYHGLNMLDDDLGDNVDLYFLYEFILSMGLVFIFAGFFGVLNDERKAKR